MSELENDVNKWILPWKDVHKAPLFLNIKERLCVISLTLPAHLDTGVIGVSHDRMLSSRENDHFIRFPYLPNELYSLTRFTTVGEITGSICEHLQPRSLEVQDAAISFSKHPDTPLPVALGFRFDGVPKLPRDPNGQEPFDIIALPSYKIIYIPDTIKKPWTSDLHVWYREEGQNNILTVARDTIGYFRSINPFSWFGHGNFGSLEVPLEDRFLVHSIPPRYPCVAPWYIITDLPTILENLEILNMVLITDTTARLAIPYWVVHELVQNSLYPEKQESRRARNIVIHYFQMGCAKIVPEHEGNSVHSNSQAVVLACLQFRESNYFNIVVTAVRNLAKKTRYQNIFTLDELKVVYKMCLRGSHKVNKLTKPKNQHHKKHKSLPITSVMGTKMIPSLKKFLGDRSFFTKRYEVSPDDEVINAAKKETLENYQVLQASSSTSQPNGPYCETCNYVEYDNNVAPEDVELVNLVTEDVMRHNAEDVELQNVEQDDLVTEDVPLHNVVMEDVQLDTVVTEDVELQNVEQDDLVTEDVLLHNVVMEDVQLDTVVTEDVELQNVEQDDLVTEDVLLHNVVIEDVQLDTVVTEHVELQNVEPDDLVTEDVRLHNGMKEDVQLDTVVTEDVELQNVEPDDLVTEDVRQQNGVTGDVQLQKVAPEDVPLTSLDMQIFSRFETELRNIEKEYHPNVLEDIFRSLILLSRYWDLFHVTYDENQIHQDIEIRIAAACELENIACRQHDVNSLRILGTLLAPQRTNYYVEKSACIFENVQQLLKDPNKPDINPLQDCITWVVNFVDLFYFLNTAFNQKPFIDELDHKITLPEYTKLQDSLKIVDNKFCNPHINSALQQLSRLYEMFADEYGEETVPDNNYILVCSLAIFVVRVAGLTQNKPEDVQMLIKWYEQIMARGSARLTLMTVYAISYMLPYLREPEDNQSYPMIINLSEKTGSEVEEAKTLEVTTPAAEPEAVIVTTLADKLEAVILTTPADKAGISSNKVDKTAPEEKDEIDCNVKDNHVEPCRKGIDKVGNASKRVSETNSIYESVCADDLHGAKPKKPKRYQMSTDSVPETSHNKRTAKLISPEPNESEYCNKRQKKVRWDNFKHKADEQVAKKEGNNNTDQKINTVHKFFEKLSLNCDEDRTPKSKRERKEEQYHRKISESDRTETEPSDLSSDCANMTQFVRDMRHALTTIHKSCDNNGQAFETKHKKHRGQSREEIEQCRQDLLQRNERFERAVKLYEAKKSHAVGGALNKAEDKEMKQNVQDYRHVSGRLFKKIEHMLADMR